MDTTRLHHQGMLRIPLLWFLLAGATTMSDLASGGGSTEQVLLRASVTRTGETALVSLTLGNFGKLPLIIFDQPVGYQSLRVPDAVGRLFSHVELLNDGTVLLGVIVPYPGTKSVEVGSIPCVTVVPPGTEVSRSATLPLPLDEFNSYYGILPESATKLMTGSAAAVAVSYLWLEPDIKLIRDEKSGCERVEALPYYKLEKKTVMAGSVQIPIRKRFDRFHVNLN